MTPDPSSPGRVTVAIAHLVGAHHYRTIYSNLAAVATDIAENEAVRAGQALGTPGVSGSGVAMIHFQLDDFESLPRHGEPERGEPRAVPHRGGEIGVRERMVAGELRR